MAFDGFDGATGSVTVAGQTADQATKEKVLLCCGNVHGVSQVADMMTVKEPADESSYYTVVRGDTTGAFRPCAGGWQGVHQRLSDRNLLSGRCAVQFPARA